MEDRREDRSLGSLFSDLTNQMATLVRQELDLARTEVSVKATAVTRDAAMIGIGGALLYAALLAALVMVGLLLVELGLAPWLSALIVAIAVGMAVSDRRRARLLRDLPDAGVQHGTGASDHDLQVAEAQAARTAGGTGYTGGSGI